MRWMGAIAALAALAGAGTGRAAQPAPEPAPVEVMVLGTWHFSNPGQDVINVEAEDVRSERRQRELRALAEALAAFRPTKIMVERVAPTPDLIDPGYREFTAATLLEKRDERVQIAYRLAHMLGHDRVYAIDEQPAAGEPDYFPFGKVMETAQEHGQAPILQQALARVEARKQEFQEKQPHSTLAELLIGDNDPDAWANKVTSYYAMLPIGDAETQPGAELNAMWYMRNAKIFAKAMQVAEPGDRIFMIFGSSHAYWLRHFAAEVEGYRNVDPIPYLRRALD